MLSAEQANFFPVTCLMRRRCWTDDRLNANLAEIQGTGTGATVLDPAAEFGEIEAEAYAAAQAAQLITTRESDSLGGGEDALWGYRYLAISLPVYHKELMPFDRK